MTGKKKWLRPQVILPAVTVLVLIIIAADAMVRPPQMLLMERADTPPYVEFYPPLREPDEKGFYQSATVAVYARLIKGTEYYMVRPVWKEYPEKMSVCEIEVLDVILNSERHPVSAGKRYRVHSYYSDLSMLSENWEQSEYILILSDYRDTPGFTPDPRAPKGYYDRHFEVLGFHHLYWSASIFQAEDGMVRTLCLPEYLQGDGEMTTPEMLGEILRAGRKKYGLTGTAE